MAGPLLETKFHVPRRRGLVARPRLSERSLDRGTTLSPGCRRWHQGSVHDRGLDPSVAAALA